MKKSKSGKTTVFPRNVLKVYQANPGNMDFSARPAAQLEVNQQFDESIWIS